TSVFEKKETFVAFFESVDGLTPGSPVWLRGVEVGNVRSIKFDEERRKIKITCKVERGVWHLVTTDSKVKINSIGLIGDKYVQVEPGSPTAPVLEPNGELAVEETDAEKIFREGASALEGMNKLNVDLRKVMGMIADGEGTLGKIVADTMLYHNLNKTLSELNSTLATLNKNQERVFANLEDGVAAFERITDALTDSGGTIGRLMFDTTLYTNLTSLTTKLDGIIAKVDSGQGTIGGLVNDEQVYVKVRDLIARLENLILDMETNPKKYFKVSVF
ncbi:MAG TPA: MlaD family protein, partial [candidate division Zixibacteria bacterium]|nr:MlaD family protein [candidate division Zixibacteria bacterium]